MEKNRRKLSRLGPTVQAMDAAFTSVPEMTTLGQLVIALWKLKIFASESSILDVLYTSGVGIEVSHVNEMGECVLSGKINFASFQRIVREFVDPAPILDTFAFGANGADVDAVSPTRVASLPTDSPTALEKRRNTRYAAAQLISQLTQSPNQSDLEQSSRFSLIEPEFSRANWDRAASFRASVAPSAQSRANSHFSDENEWIPIAQLRAVMASYGVEASDADALGELPIDRTRRGSYTVKASDLLQALSHLDEDAVRDDDGETLDDGVELFSDDGVSGDDDSASALAKARSMKYASFRRLPVPKKVLGWMPSGEMEVERRALPFEAKYIRCNDRGMRGRAYVADLPGTNEDWRQHLLLLADMERVKHSKRATEALEHRRAYEAKFGQPQRDRHEPPPPLPKLPPTEQCQLPQISAALTQTSEQHKVDAQRRKRLWRTGGPPQPATSLVVEPESLVQNIFAKAERAALIGVPRQKLLSDREKFASANERRTNSKRRPHLR